VRTGSLLAGHYGSIPVTEYMLNSRKRRPLAGHYEADLSYHYYAADLVTHSRSKNTVSESEVSKCHTIFFDVQEANWSRAG
jgi:hypothetical protein